MSRTCSLRLTMVVASFVVAACASTAHATVIASWQFDGANFLADSSGNGHTLVNTGDTANGGAVQSSDAAVGSGSALFNGTAIMKTIDSIDLTPYEKVSVSWWMKATGIGSGGIGLVYEQSPNYNDYTGAFITYLNGANNPASAYLRCPNRYNGKDFSHPYGAWTHIQVDYDLTAKGDDAVKTYVDGVKVGTTFDGNDPPVSFANQTFYLGAIPTVSVCGFKGYIDNFAIEGTAIPEPGTFSLVTIGLLGLLAYAWRKRK